MSATASIPAPPYGPGRLLRETARGILRTGLRAVVLGVALIALYQVHLAAQQPGRVIRRELAAAAGEFRGQVMPNPSGAVLTAMRRHFREPAVDVAAGQFSPNVAVTIRGLGQEACASAAREARRIDGPVVVDLVAYRSPADCGAANDMTWWIMP